MSKPECTDSHGVKQQSEVS